MQDERDTGSAPAATAPAGPALGVDRGDKIHVFQGAAPAKLRVSPQPGGPLKLEGPFSLAGAGGAMLPGSSVSLCRCGRSRNKPFCDGSHELPR